MLIRRRKHPVLAEAAQHAICAEHVLDTPKRVLQFVRKVRQQSGGDGVVSAQCAHALCVGMVALLTHYRLDDISRATNIPMRRLRSYLNRTGEPTRDDVDAIFMAFGLHFQLVLTSRPTSWSGRAVQVDP